MEHNCAQYLISFFRSSLLFIYTIHGGHLVAMCGATSILIFITSWGKWFCGNLVIHSIEEWILRADSLISNDVKMILVLNWKERDWLHIKIKIVLLFRLFVSLVWFTSSRYNWDKFQEFTVLERTLRVATKIPFLWFYPPLAA